MMGIDMKLGTETGSSWESCGKIMNHAQRVVIHRKMNIHSTAFHFSDQNLGSQFYEEGIYSALRLPTQTQDFESKRSIEPPPQRDQHWLVCIVESRKMYVARDLNTAHLVKIGKGLLPDIASEQFTKRFVGISPEFPDELLTFFHTFHTFLNNDFYTCWQDRAKRKSPGGT